MGLGVLLHAVVVVVVVAVVGGGKMKGKMEEALTSVRGRRRVGALGRIGSCAGRGGGLDCGVGGGDEKARLAVVVVAGAGRIGSIGTRSYLSTRAGGRLYNI